MIRKLCDVNQLPREGQLRAFVDASASLPIALCVGLLDGTPYAIENKCPHQGAPLSAGTVSGDLVACPLHGWKWRLTDGKAASPFDPDVLSFELRQYENEIFVRLPASLPASAQIDSCGKQCLPHNVRF